MEDGDEEPNEYYKFLVSILYPCGAKFGKLTDAWGLCLTHAIKQVKKYHSLEAENFSLGFKYYYIGLSETVRSGLIEIVFSIQVDRRFPLLSRLWTGNLLA